ncbi:MAG TPA: glycosyltransferase, partial [Acidimicrobiia bacterium]|nr:glycosyltransferase [Acidimicrobiia bacterium]
VVAPVVQALLPRTIAEWNNSGKGPRVAEATVRRGAALLLVATALLVPLVPLADTWGILHWVSGHRDFALVVVLAAVGIGLNGVVRLVYGLMLAQGRAGAAMRAFWIVLAFAAVLVPALTHLYGIAGTAAASLAVYLALMVVTARSALTDRRQVDRAASRNGPGRTHDAVVALGVTEFFPASGAGEITGGVEARAFYLARYFGPERLRVIASRTDGSRWEYASLGSVPRRLWFMATAFARGLRQRFDVVEGSNLVTHPVAWLLGVVRRRPVVFFYPDVVVDVERIDGSRTTRSLETLLERLVLRLPASRYIAPSEAVARKLALRGVAVDRIRVIPCGVDGPLVERLAPPTSARTTAHDLAVIGRLVPYKRVDLVLEAVAELSETFPDLSVVVVGQGPEAEHLAAEARRLGIADRVDFRGFVTEHEEVLRVLATSRVFVSASEAEGFGIVLAEAMALGVPYVVADIPAFREVSGEGHGGYLFAPGDRHDLARGLEEIFGARPDEYDRMSRAACGFARGRYTWEAVAQATADVYDELTRNRRIGDKGVRDG